MSSSGGLRIARADPTHVQFDRDGALEERDRGQQPLATRPDNDSSRTGQGAAGDTDRLPYGRSRFRLHGQPRLYDDLERLQLFFIDRDRRPAEADNMDDAGQAHHGKPVVNIEPAEEISREERRFPPACRPAELRKKYVVSLP